MKLTIIRISNRYNLHVMLILVAFIMASGIWRYSSKNRTVYYEHPTGSFAVEHPVGWGRNTLSGGYYKGREDVFLILGNRKILPSNFHALFFVKVADPYSFEEISEWGLEIANNEGAVHTSDLKVLETIQTKELRYSRVYEDQFGEKRHQTYIIKDKIVVIVDISPYSEDLAEKNKLKQIVDSVNILTP